MGIVEEVSKIKTNLPKTEEDFQKKASEKDQREFERQKIKEKEFEDLYQ